MLENLLPLLPVHDVLEEVDGDVVTIREIRLHVHREELVDLSLGAELGTEGSGGDCWLVLVSGLHTVGLFDLRL